MAKANPTEETNMPFLKSKAISSQEHEAVSSSSNSKRTNPFLSEEEEKTFGKSILIDYLLLSAILYSSFSSNSRAIINGQILKIGNYIDNKEVVKIEPEEVILKDDQNEYCVRLKKVVGQ